MAEAVVATSVVKPIVAAAAPAPGAWREAVPEHYETKGADGKPVNVPLRAHKTLDKFTDVGTLARSYVELEQAHSVRQEGMIRVPGKDAKPEEVAAFREATGVPKSVDGYTFDIPEGQRPLVPEATHTEFKGLFHAAGLTPAQAQAVVAGYASYAERTLGAGRKANRKAFAEWKTTAGQATYDADTASALKAIEQFGPEGWKAEVKSVPLEDLDIHVVRAFAAIGRKLSEQGILPAQSFAGHSKTTAEARRQEILTDKDFQRGTHKEQARLQQEYEALSKFVHDTSG